MVPSKSHFPSSQGLKQLPGRWGLGCIRQATSPARWRGTSQVPAAGSLAAAGCRRGGWGGWGGGGVGGGAGAGVAVSLDLPSQHLNLFGDFKRHICFFLFVFFRVG